MFYILYLFFMYVTVHVTVHREVREQLEDIRFSFHHMGPQDQTQWDSVANALSEPSHHPKWYLKKKEELGFL